MAGELLGSGTKGRAFCGPLFFCARSPTPAGAPCLVFETWDHFIQRMPARRDRLALGSVKRHASDEARPGSARNAGLCGSHFSNARSGAPAFHRIPQIHRMHLLGVRFGWEASWPERRSGSRLSPSSAVQQFRDDLQAFLVKRRAGYGLASLPVPVAGVAEIALAPM